MRQADVYMAGALMMILAVLIIPVPTTLLDILLTLSIGLGVLVLLLTTQIREVLHLSAFPSLLLLLTLFRLSLNVATTRQILLTGFGGNVIGSFGNFVVGGNYVVGAVIFLILTAINFMVITKGSGRIAEVAARFTLDSMPGKQMSIDADLNSGLIDEKEAIRRREELSQEADFYGAMDGASKFVRGDAVAGLIITLINVAGGFAIGMLQRGMSAGDSLRTYTLLTIGDGLVSQIPALVISTAAAMLVTRAASNNTLGMEVGRQVFMRANPMLLTGGILSAMAFVPGLPFLPFIVMGGAVGGAGYVVRQRRIEEKMDAAAKAGPELPAGMGKAKGALPAAGDKDKVKQIPAVSAMDLEIGFGLVPLVDSKQGGKLIERIGLVRGQIAEELGVVLPPVNVRDNMRLKTTEYAIRIRGVEITRGTVRPGFWMAISPPGGAKLEGFLAVKEPAFGFDAYWIPEEKKEAVESKGLTVVDCSSVITTHLAEIAKRHASDILSRQDASDMIDHLKETHPSVVNELIPNKFTAGGIHRVLQRLLRERVSVRDLSLILESIADHAGRTQDPGLLAEFCRKELGAHICLNYQAADGSLSALGLHPDAEALIKKSTRREANELGTLIMEPELARGLLDSLRRMLESVRQKGHEPVILCSPLVRPQLRYLIEHDFPNTAVLSFAEVPDTTSVNMMGMIPAPARAEAALQEAQA